MTKRPKPKPDPMSGESGLPAGTRAEWVQAALDARVAQGFSIAIEDPATLDFLADVLSHPGNRDHR